MTPTSSVSRQFPTLRYLVAPFRWLFGNRRRAVTAATVLLAMIAAPVLWWSIQLLGLPDIGDPFDVAKFRAFRIPDDRNAYVLYSQAGDRLKPLVRSNTPRNQKVDSYARWSKADPAVRRWVDENREAMALYRRGSERPDALDPAHPSNLNFWKLGEFHTLALLEASRLEEQGDMAGAWAWYRADLRATHHIGMHAVEYCRLMAQRWHAQLLDRSATWAADRRTNPAMLRQALDDAIACDALEPSDSYTLEAEYIEADRMLDDPNSPVRGRIPPWSLSVASVEMSLSPEQLKAIHDAWRSWRREPERSRRVIRLMIANWLACHDLPPDRRPAPDANVSGPFEFYAFGPEAPANARALSPEALDRWLATTTDAHWVFPIRGLRGIHIKERANYRALLVLLASELYRRDRGTDPPSEEALVGPYLESLPDDGTGGASTRRPAAAVQ